MSDSSRTEGIKEEIRQLQKNSYYNAACIAAFNELSFAISIQNEQTQQFIYCNRAFQDWMHVEESEIIGKKAADLFPQDPEPVEFECPTNWPLKGEFKRIKAKNQEFLVQTHQIRIPGEESDEILLLNIYLDKSKEAQELARLCQKEKDFENSEILAKTGHWTFDFASDRMQHSSQSQRILGLPADQDSHNWMKFLYYVHPKDRQRVNSSFKQAAIHQTLFQEKFRLRANDNESKRLQVRGYFEYNEYGTPSRFLGVFVDISEYDENARKLEALLRELSESDALAKLGHWTYEHSTNEITLSSEISRLYKLSQNQFTFRTLLELIVPSDHKKLSNIFRDKADQFETNLQININQQTRCIHLTGRKFFDSQGKLFKSLGTVQDITEQKHTTPIETSSDILQGIFSRSQDGMLLFKVGDMESEQPEFLCHDVNRAFLQQFSIEKEKVVNRSFYQLFSKRAQPWVEHMKSAIKEETAKSWEIYRPSLERYFNISVYSPRRDFIILRFHDITTSKQIEEEYKTSDLHFRVLMENSIDTFWIATIELKPILISRSASVIRGYSMQEIYNQTLKEKLTESSFQTFNKYFEPFLKQVQKGNQSHKPVLDINLDFRHKNGSTIPVHTRITAVYDAEKHPVALVGVNRLIHLRDRSSQSPASSLSTPSGFENIGLWCFDAETEAFLVTQNTLELINYNKNHIENIYNLKDWVHLVVHSDDRSQVFKTMQQALKKGQGWEISYRLKTEQNERKTLYETTQVELDNKNRIVRIWGILQDQSAEQKGVTLQYSDNSFILQSFPDIFIQLDRNMHVKYMHVPPCYRDIFDQKENQSIDKVLPDEVKHAVLSELQNASIKKQVKFHLTHQGVQKPFEARIIPDQQEQSILILRELEKSEDGKNIYKTILDKTPERIACFDDSGTLIYANATFYELLGYTENDWEDQSELDIVHSDDKDDFKEAFKSVQEKGRTSCGYRVKDKSGSWRYMKAYATLLTSEEYESCSLWVMQEVTEDKAMSEQYQDGFLAQLPSTIAGDFTDILQVIENYNDMILDALPKEEVAYEYAKNIKDTCDNGAAMVRRLIHFSSPTRMKLQKTDLNILIFNLTRTMDRLFGPTITIRFIPDVNAKPINIDPEMIEDLVMNLCMNARDATDQNGEIIIHTRNRIFEKENPHPSLSPGHYIMISVQDNGPGIPADLREKIFEPFFTTKTTPKSIGLGLSIVKNIAEQHNGLVELDPKAKQGALFNVYLAVDITDARKSSTEYPGGNETLLIADDEPHICEISRTYLEEIGYKILISHDGEEAIEMYKHHQNEIDMLILDVLMPNKNGKEVYDDIKELGGEIPVLFCSGYTLNLLKNEHNIDIQADLLKKPFNKKELLQSVRHILDTKKRNSS